MAKYIKSHSNYRLSSNHQDTKKGTILERDISTIGGVDTFATGQSTIYSSGNFVMTINNESSASRHVLKRGWLANSESGDTWNADVLENYTSDINGSVEKSIQMKNDFMDLRAFSCYGSLYNLVQSSITDILERYPYEIYTGTGDIEYKIHKLEATIDASRFGYSGDVKTNSASYYVDTNFIEYMTSGTPVTYVSGYTNNLYEISNPANIDMHTTMIDDIDIKNELRYFANGGSDNYSLFYDEYSTNPIDGYSFSWKSVQENVHKQSNTLRRITITPKTGKDYLNSHEIVTFTGTTIITSVSYKGKVVTFDKSKKYYNGDVIYLRYKDGNFSISEIYCPEPGDYVATITLTPTFGKPIEIFAFRDNDLSIKYLVERDNLFIHIRPKPSLGFYDDFIDSSDMFQRALLGVFTGQKNTAKFEILDENDGITTKSIQTFILPIGDGGYNLDTGGIPMRTYIQSLARIGARYDEYYTDNMYRNMTHESLKNFDWTRDFNGNDNDYENSYIENGERFKSIIRIMGYVFDQEKSYIDTIKNVNTITYDNRSNLSDYFLSDSLELDGWDVVTIHPFDLKEFDRENGEEISPSEWSEISQRNNHYTRKFSENVTEILTPFKYNEGGWIETCESGTPISYYIENDNGKAYHVDSDGVVRNVIRNYSNDDEYTVPDISNAFMKRLKINSKHILRKKGTIEGVESLLSLFGFKSKRWFSALDTTRTKGKFEKKYNANLERKLPFDYEINEYVGFAAPIKETWDKTHNMYQVDYYNTAKTIPYNTESYINGIYIPYQGLPVSYRDIDGRYIASHFVEGQLQFYETTNENDPNNCTDENGRLVNARRLYPDFESNGIYDGDMYYQMHGGWISYWPYSFDTNSDAVINYSGKANKETLRNVKQVKDLEKLLSQPIQELREGSVYYVNELKKDYAVMDGQLYELFYENNGDDTIYRYFYVTVFGGSVSIGNTLFTDYITISNPYSQTGEATYYLPSCENGFMLRIYYTPSEEKPFKIYGYSDISYYRVTNNDGIVAEEPCDSDDYGAKIKYNNEIYVEDVKVFINGSYHTETNQYTHYFKLNNIYEPYVLSENGWKQLRYSDPEYLKASSIVDNYKGNNPHSGGYGYDNGHEYMFRFTRLFKYPLENDLFNEDCFSEATTEYSTIYDIGFSGLTNPDIDMKDYSSYLHKDKKIHSFCDKLTNKLKNKPIGTSVTYKKNANGHYQKIKKYLYLNDYDIESKSSLSGITDYEFVKDIPDADGVSSQIVNTKVVDIKFYLQCEDFYSKECQEEIKFIQDKVMPYVEQMLPSTAIIRLKMYVHPFNWVLDGDDIHDTGKWHDYFYWSEDGKWIDGE